MGKKDIIGLLEKPFPFELSSIFMILPDLFFVWMLGDVVLVAFHTDGYSWHAGEGLFFSKGMAGMAFNTLFVMFFMVEREGLFRSDA